MAASVRKVYQVIVNGLVVFSGSYASCVSVYEAFAKFASLYNEDLNLVIAFKL